MSARKLKPVLEDQGINILLGSLKRRSYEIQGQKTTEEAEAYVQDN